MSKHGILGVMAAAMLACNGGADTDGGDGGDGARDYTSLGTFGVDVTTFQMDLADRGDGFPDDVDTRLYAPSTGSGMPVVMLNHGFATRTDQYHDTAEHLASWGFVVLVPQWDPGIPTARTHQGLADDVVAAIDWLYANPLPLDVEPDVSLLGVGGHSRGGKQSIHAAALDERILAGFQIDPVDSLPPFGEVDPADFPSVAPELLADITIPMGIVGMGYGAADTVACAPEEDNYAAYWAGIGEGVLVELPNAGHNDIVDECATGGGGLACISCTLGDDPAATVAAVQGSMAAFYLEHLMGDDTSAWDGGLVETYPSAEVLTK